MYYYEKRIIKTVATSGRFALTISRSRRAVFVAGGDVRVRAQVVVFVLRRGRGRGSGRGVGRRVFERDSFGRRVRAHELADAAVVAKTADNSQDSNSEVPLAAFATRVVGDQGNQTPIVPMARVVQERGT